jgi:hypothetical protein
MFYQELLASMEYIHTKIKLYDLKRTIQMNTTTYKIPQ